MNCKEDYFENEDGAVKGLPTVQYLSQELNLSANYQYWENQEKHLSDKHATKDEQINDLADYLQAQNQLKYWKASQQK